MKVTKTNKIIQYMRSKDGITQLDAYKLCCATRLGAIIFELKKRGMQITTTMLNGDDCRYAKYSFTPEYKEYLNYRDDWYIHHGGPEFNGMEPACYGEWLDNHRC